MNEIVMVPARAAMSQPVIRISERLIEGEQKRLHRMVMNQMLEEMERAHLRMHRNKLWAEIRAALSGVRLESFACNGL